MKLLLAFLSLGFVSLLHLPAQTQLSIRAHIYILKAPLDVSTITAIGSPGPKTPSTILQVSKDEMKRVEKVVMDAGGTLATSPRVRTLSGQEAKIWVSGNPECTLIVTPENLGSDTTTLAFTLNATTPNGNRKTIRSIAVTARAQEANALLFVAKPEAGQPGILVVLEAERSEQ